MESLKVDDQQQEEDNKFLVNSSCYALSCYQNQILNDTRDYTNSRDVKQHIYHKNVKAHELQQLARTNHKLSITRSYLENHNNIISCNPTSSTTEDFMSNINIQRIGYTNNNNQDMMLKTFQEDCQIKSDQLINLVHSSNESMFHSFDTSNYHRGTFSQILPTLNATNLNQSSSSFDTTFNGSSSYQPSTYNAHNLGGLFKDNCMSYGGCDQMNIKIPPAFIFETTKAERLACDYRYSKHIEASPTKKSKLGFHPSCTPLKVRKEKLGDRISALQQMVAPFGKTDTASVLTEAIGYIKFLQSQVEGSIKDGNQDLKRDLRSRGLCLVPVSCLTYVWATM